MNIIINGFQDQRTIPIVMKLVSSLKVKSLVFTYNTFKPDFSGFSSGATLINWRKINFYGDYGIDFNTLKPLDEEIVDSMRKCEAVVLKMMDRLETLKDYSYRERKELYLKHLRYWNDLVERKKIDFFLSSNVPHETSDFVCYSLCKLKNIQTVMLFQTHIPDTCFICEDWESSDYGIISEYKKLKERYIGYDPDDIKLTKRFEEYYRIQTEFKINSAPFYMFKKSLFREGRAKIVSISGKLRKDPMVYFREAGVVTRALTRRFSNYFRVRLLMNYYERRCTKFDPKEKYFFVALHVQPEMSTSPRADVYVEQLLMIQLLSAVVPSDTKIFVKEHPNQQSHTRSKEYYQQILSLPNARLMSRRLNSADLISSCLAVVTCVGLVGFEGLFRGKPLLMFGHDFFQHSPGVFSIRTRFDLKLAIDRILKGPTFSPRDFKIFLKAMENVSVNGTIDSDYLLTSNLEDSNNTSNITQAIFKKLGKTRV